ncbi:SusC/RagA family TonB-linked outer membrane protein [Pedobacter gandavensis]|uniref:SusC/RagA family TonB-linked outer membrane protein n=1 Tax=Pedobacter gandavensis TaxID=2679963 RepID=UPI00292E72B1|nr:SusC/RagA family TonB-linked outer membrane protein [Pedobacter gandavensis]
MTKLLLKMTWLSFAALFWSIGVYAQTGRTVSGTVKDETGSPMPAVSVRVKETKKSTSTNAAGKFVIDAVPGNTLEFRYVGYVSKDAVVGADGVVNVSLSPSDNALKEVSVEGALGVKKIDRNLGYSVTKIKGDEITRTNTVNPITGLQGKVAGVNINVVGTAGVQTSPYIQIRGAKVLGSSDRQANNQPIFVIDGQVITNNIVGGDAADGGSQLKSLNPDDYESITILKGAAATTLYGSRGLNGAVVINTKRGKSGPGLGIEVNSTYQTTEVYKSFMDLQNEHGMGSYLSREGNFRPDGTQSLTTGNWGPKFDGRMTPAIYNPSKLVPYEAQPDNWKTFYRNGNYINNNVALGGSTDKFNYRVSYSNTSNKGILPNNGLKRDAIDVKVGGEINKIFSSEMGISYANTRTSNYFNQSRFSVYGDNALAFSTYYLPRNIDFADWYAGYRNPANNEIYTYSKPGGNFDAVVNTFSRIDKKNYTNHENSLLGFLQLKAQVNPWLDFSARGNFNYQKNFAESKEYGNEKDNKGGYYSAGGGYSTDYTLLFMAHANKDISDDLNVDVRLINEIYGDKLGETYSANTNGGLAVPNFFFLDNSVKPIQGDAVNLTTRKYSVNKPSRETIGIAGVVNFSYKKYLNLELSGRNDWISVLTYPKIVPGKNNNSVFYPSANLSYIFSDHFKEDMPSWLSFGKIRASIAYVGSAGIARPFDTGAGYSPSVIIDQNGQTVPAATQINGDTKPNYDLRPQRQREIEFGTTLSFLKNRIDVDFAWYKGNTYDQLLKLDGVPETGYKRTFFNAGNIQNKGFEASVSGAPIRTKDWGLDLSLNLAHNRSKIIKFGGGITSWNITGDYEGGQVWAYEGGDFGVLEMRANTTVKIDPATGFPLIINAPRLSNATADVKYNVANYNLVDNSDSDLPNGRLPIGRVEPSLTGGFSVNLRYKSFSLFTQMDARFGGYVYSETYAYSMGNGVPLASLKYRDEAHGGVARIDSYTGQTVYDGAVPDAVFAPGQMSLIDPTKSIAGMTFRSAYDQGLVEPWKASVYYTYTKGWQNALNNSDAITKMSWLMLREVTLGYQIPFQILDKVKIKGARLSFTARNLGYLYNSLTGGQNPESVQSNDPFSPWITGGVPFTRNYAVSLNVKF